ncbi:MAG: LPS export ABC transporter periplasmic protein LptC [Gammaproteobacteria bacterium]|nr:LPS export ABC transporter periplasmic protein LptC [Gammaproteobacteria bacterium]MCP5415830.1 LPS export ABC transporter periplasmic protein LptC [Chromatiaceae bacterium]
MIAGNKNLTIGLVLLLLLLGTGWLNRSVEKNVDYRPNPHSPDYFLKHFTITTMGLQGSPDKRLSARAMIHFPDDDTTELDNPIVTIHEEDRQPWKVHAETGWVSGDKELLFLQGKVNIERPDAPGLRPFHIVTSDLRIQPGNNYAETDAVAHIQSRDDWVDSTGLQIWFAKPIRVKLLANVRGFYENR